jgi:ethanolamine utilization microcompartment shell protein EutL
VVPKFKSADEAVTSSTAFQDDDNLLFPVANGETWAFEMLLIVTGANAGDVKVALSNPANTSISWGGIGQTSGDTNANDTNVNIQAHIAGGDANFLTYAAVGANSPNTIIIRGTVTVNSGAGGNVVLRWAQSNSSSTATTIRARSHLIATRVSP